MKEGAFMYETKKLYYEDVYKKEFTAKVLECRESKKGYEIILNQTAFYPEGGGQPSDTGILGGINVKEVHEKDGELIHYTDGPLEVGMDVIGKINWGRRFDLMQQHSGEHIVSGLVHEAFGYDNVGFHMGSSRSNWPEAWRNLYPSRDCSTRGIYFDQRYHLYPERGWNR